MAFNCPNCGKEFDVNHVPPVCPLCFTNLTTPYRLQTRAGSTMDYKCSKCGGLVLKSATVCPHCHARLGGIRCQNCGFVGGIADFTNDRCPHCSTVIQRSQTIEDYKENPDKEAAKACIWGAVIIIGAFLLIALFAAMQ